MLKKIKLAVLHSSKALGVFALASGSRWRRERLLILAYHGISLEDEHQWNPGLFMTPEHFASRLELLKRTGCHVLPLGEALLRLESGDLPEKSVALTFDDGFYDFYQLAFPLLQRYAFPVTLYLTTYYSFYNRPVFDVICSYLLWKGRNETIDGAEFTGEDSALDLASDASRAAVMSRIRDFVMRGKLDAEEKDSLAAALAKRLKVDYEAILSKRILHLLNPAEVQKLAAQDVDIQLHTHRHRTPPERGLFLRELEDNRHAIEELTHSPAKHFCYPSGVSDTRFFPWLEETSVVSATTCEPGFATRSTHKFLLPRLLDSTPMPAIEFESWLTGLASVLPQRDAPAEEVGYSH
jgi:peptidoglycan/xylan/chitin deacetylase (PgdA/CDA1 family)